MKCSIYIVISFFFFYIGFCFAQETNGNIEGQIVDTSNVPLIDVNISLQSDNLQGILGSAADENGYFQVLNLPLGSYQLKISYVGYQTVTIKDVQIALGKTTNLGAIHLKSRAVDLKEVVVSGKKAIIDPASTTYGGNLKFKDFEALPIDRDYRNMMSLLPLASINSYGGGIDFAGSTSSENKFIIDGVEVNDPGGNVVATRLPYNFIKEVNVKIGGYEPEFDAATGAVITAVTKSGTNQFHGSVFGYYTNNSLIRHSALAPSQGNFSNYDVGFGMGGPIIHDKLWFYAAYNPTFNRREVDVPGYGTSLDKTYINKFAVKLDCSASQNLTFIFTLTGSPSKHHVLGADAPLDIKLLNPDPYFTESNVGMANIALTGNYIIRKNLFLQASFSRIYRSDRIYASTEIGRDKPTFFDVPSWTVSGGYLSSTYDSRYGNNIKIKGTYKTGKHLVNAGFEYKANVIDIHEESNIIYEYNSSTYQQSKGGNFGEAQYRIPYFFLQDSWRIFHNLRIYGGVKFGEEFLLGSDENVDQKITIPIQPRIGFVFLPSEDGLRIFGSFGRFAQEFGLYAATYFFNSNRYYFNTYYDHNPLVDNTGGYTVADSAYIQPEVSGLRATFFDEFSLGYQRLFGKNFSVSLQGIYRVLRETIDDAYLPSLSTSILGNPGRGILSGYPKPYRRYTALVFTVEHRFDEHFNFLASYVLSRNYGNYEGLFDSYNSGGIPNKSVAYNSFDDAWPNITGLLPNDRTHIFKFSGSYQFQFGLIVGISFDFETGTPLNQYAKSSNHYYIRFLVPRGTAGRTPSIWNLSARFMYNLLVMNSYNAKVILDVFNIASQLKPINIDQTAYQFDSKGNITTNTTYGKVIRYQDPMSARFGLEVSF